MGMGRGRDRDGVGGMRRSGNAGRSGACLCKKRQPLLLERPAELSDDNAPPSRERVQVGTGVRAGVGKCCSRLVLELVLK